MKTRKIVSLKVVLTLVVLIVCATMKAQVKYDSMVDLLSVTQLRMDFMAKQFMVMACILSVKQVTSFK